MNPKSVELRSVQDLIAFLQSAHSEMDGGVPIGKKEESTVRAMPELSSELLFLVQLADQVTVSPTEAAHLMRTYTTSFERTAAEYGISPNHQGRYLLADISKLKQKIELAREDLLSELADLTQALEATEGD